MHLRRLTIVALLTLIPAACVVAEPKDKVNPADAGLPVIDWKDAAKHMGEQVIVQGKIVETGAARTISFLNFDRDRTFTAIIRKKNYSNFSGDVRLLYVNKIVRIRGRISEYKGKTQIEVFKPEQITILAEETPIPGQPVASKRVFDGTVTLATYNVLNLFDSYDDPYHDDEGTSEKPADAKSKLAQTIREVDADVIAFQEVENRGCLKTFVRSYLGGMGYDNVVCFESNDGRGIDCAVLSRLPVGPVTSYRHVLFDDGKGGKMRFRRDLIQVRIEPPECPAFDVFVVHLKSKHGGATGDRIRTSEAKGARNILDGILEHHAKSRFVICGDFNDTWDSESLKILRGGRGGKPELKSFHGDVDDKIPTYNKKPYRSKIDFILCSPAMAKLYVPKSFKILEGSINSSGSDHNPVIVKFDVKSKKAA